MPRPGLLLPPLALMGLIFFLSAQPHLSSGLGTWDLVLRKLGHMTEYGLLWWLWSRAVGPRAALAITLGFAATDEYHQTFVDGRHGTPIDVAIDAVGVTAAWLATVWLPQARATRARSR